MILILGLAALALGVAPGPRGDGIGDFAPDLGQLLEEARRVQRRDLEGWRRFSFHREVLREKLDRHGTVKFRQTLEFHVEPAAGSFDEELLRIDGRAPTGGEVKSHRSAGRFYKHFREMLSGQSQHSLLGADLSLPSILGRATYLYRRQEVLDGTACHRLDMVAQPPRRGPSSQELADATEGSLWISVDGAHMVRWRSRLVRPVSRGIARVQVLDLQVDFAPHDGVWLPEEIELRSEVGLGPITLRKRNRYRYSRFQAYPRSRGASSEKDSTTSSAVSQFDLAALLGAATRRWQEPCGGARKTRCAQTVPRVVPPPVSPEPGASEAFLGSNRDAISLRVP